MAHADTFNCIKWSLVCNFRWISCCKKNSTTKASFKWALCIRIFSLSQNHQFSKTCWICVSFFRSARQYKGFAFASQTIRNIRSATAQLFSIVYMKMLLGKLCWFFSLLNLQIRPERTLLLLRPDWQVRRGMKTFWNFEQLCLFLSRSASQGGWRWSGGSTGRGRSGKDIKISTEVEGKTIYFVQIKIKLFCVLVTYVE